MPRVIGMQHINIIIPQNTYLTIKTIEKAKTGHFFFGKF